MNERYKRGYRNGRMSEFRMFVVLEPCGLIATKVSSKSIVLKLY